MWSGDLEVIEQYVKKRKCIIHMGGKTLGEMKKGKLKSEIKISMKYWQQRKKKDVLVTKRKLATLPAYSSRSSFKIQLKFPASFQWHCQRE